MSQVVIEHFNSFTYFNRPVEVEDTFTITPKPNNSRNYKRTMKRLRKLAAVKPYNRIQKEMTVHKTKISLDSIERMLHQHIESIRQVYNCNCRMIVIGYREMDELKMAMRPITFHFPDNYQSNSVYNGRRIEFRGIEVVCVPWIDGVFAIPKTN